MKILYVYPESHNQDGGSIYHSKLVDSLGSMIEEVIPLPCNVRRHILGPVWSRRVAQVFIDRIKWYSRLGYKIILSHESIMNIAVVLREHISLDLLIVHNYFPRFQFGGLLPVGLLYRYGASTQFDQTFSLVRRCMFFGAGDYEAAQYRKKNHNIFLLNPIPPASLNVVAPSSKPVLHYSGSDQWLPKKLSAPPAEYIAQLMAKYRFRDFFDRPEQGICLLTDRFDIGQKLKLIQAMSLGDVIVSRVDLSREVSTLIEDYPGYITYQAWSQLPGTIDKAFELLKKEQKKLARCADDLKTRFTWEKHARMVVDLLSEQL